MKKQTPSGFQKIAAYFLLALRSEQSFFVPNNTSGPNVWQPTNEFSKEIFQITQIVDGRKKTIYQPFSEIEL